MTAATTEATAVTPTTPPTGAPTATPLERPTPAQTVSTLRGEIVNLRDDLGGYIDELDRRRHAALDVKAHLKRHRGALISVAAGLAALVAGAVVVRRRSAARRRSLGPAMAAERGGSTLTSALAKAGLAIVSAAVAGAVKGRLATPARSSER